MSSEGCGCLGMISSYCSRSFHKTVRSGRVAHIASFIGPASFVDPVSHCLSGEGGRGRGCYAPVRYASEPPHQPHTNPLLLLDAGYSKIFVKSMIETRLENFAGPTQRRIRVLCCVSCGSPQLSIQRNDARINWQHSQANIVAALGGVHVQVERPLEGYEVGPVTMRREVWPN